MSECGDSEHLDPEILQRRLEELTQERERLSRELVEMKQAVTKAGRVKSDFLTNMSHELRTPLSRIMGFTEVIREGMAGPVTEEQKEYLGDVYESAQQLHTLINDILELSSAQAGKAELERRDLNVRALLEACAGLFREKGAKHRINVAVHVEEDVPVVRADEQKLKQVMFNLLANAFKFMADGGKLHVTACRTGGFVQVTVRDTGIGITEADQATLFEPFNQTDQILTKKHSGAGIGLSLCREYIELHGGQIWIESLLQQGSAFSFTIPVGPFIGSGNDENEIRGPAVTGYGAEQV